MSRTRKALAGLVAAPLAVLSTVSAVTLAGPAQAASPDAPVISVPTSRVYFSPNKDKVQDKAVFPLYLAKKAKVTVKVRRDNKKRTLVYKQELGKLDAGHRHRWAWKGKNANGKVVRDGKYAAHFVADQVGKDGKKRIRSVPVVVDSKFTAVKTPTLTLDTIYPRTTVLRDAVGVKVGGRGRLASVNVVELHVRDEQGRLVRTIRGGTGWRRYVTMPFDGRDSAGNPLPGGKYRLWFKVTDRAGNTGKTDKVTLNISNKPLVEKTGTLVLPPTGNWKASEVLAGTAPAPTPPSVPRENDTSPYPCGTVVPSQVYANPGALSYRSDDTCTGSFAVQGLWATGTVQMDNITFENSPRGSVYSALVSMRGRPTVPGETDTATLTLGAPALGFNGVLEMPRGASSPAVADETVTTTDRHIIAPPVLPYYSKADYRGTDTLSWSVVTRGADSFDVAEVTLTYSYLAPQQ